MKKILPLIVRRCRSLFTLFALSLLICVPALPAQSARMLEDIVQQERIKLGDAIFLIRLLANEISPNDDPVAIFAATDTQRWNLGNKSYDSEVLQGELAYMLMDVLDIPSGFMYAIFPGPRYAMRDLLYLGAINSDSDIYLILSGSDGLNMINSVISWVQRRTAE